MASDQLTGPSMVAYGKIRPDDGPGFRVDGKGSVLVRANFSEISSPFEELWDYFQLDAAGVGVRALRAGNVAATGLLSQLVTFDGTSVFPFLAGDHAVFVAQEFRHQAGLCHESTAGAGFIGQVDTSSMYLCPMALGGDSPIDGGALLPGP